MPLLPASSQVLALAPDAQISGAARGLAYLNKWTALGLNEGVVWGECRGSGERPYQVVVLLAGLTFHCSCPSRKRPCKHALALLLLALDHSQSIKNNDEAPAWVQERLVARKRADRANELPKQTRTAHPTESGSATTQRRMARVAAGLDELSLWLGDLVRRGLAAAQTQPPRYWDGMAARLVDAQAPGAARLVRALGGMPASGAAWPERLMAGLGQLQLLIEAHKRLDLLPPDLQADVRAVLGQSLNHEALLQEAGVHDRWQVLGRRVEEEDRLRAQRVWLWGEATKRTALILSYAAPGQSLDTRLLLGTRLDAELVFFPSAFPLRALLKAAGAAKPLDQLMGQSTFAAAAAAYADAVACNPWIERYPAVLSTATPVCLDGAWWLRDAVGAGWPIATAFGGVWSLLALSGGEPLPVFGEWDGEAFWPLSAWADGRLAILESEGVSR
jgi:hypothetical protein